VQIAGLRWTDKARETALIAADEIGYIETTTNIRTLTVKYSKIEGKFKM